MSTSEPSRLEVFLTVAAGSLMPGVYREYVHRLGLKGSERILDFGCGSGNPARHIAPILQRGGGRLTCLDISKTWIAVSRSRLKRFPNVSFVHGGIAEAGLADASFEGVFVHFTLHDIPPAERPEIAVHLARILANNGRLFLREPLKQISRVEILNLLHPTGLQDTGWRVIPAPAMGPCCEARFQKIG
jgi:ubiquinone/menaquinone biosynthesis C-methylase UbiE